MECTKTSIRVTLSIALAVLVLGVHTVAADAVLPGAKLARALRANTVHIKIKSKTKNGFGIIVAMRSDDELLIVTANHVVRKARSNCQEAAGEIEVKFFGANEYVAATLLADCDGSHDLAVLAAPVHRELMWHRIIGNATEEIAPGTPTWFVGRGSEWYVPTQSGGVNEIDRKTSQITLDNTDLFKGTSGGPVVSDSGIIGMIQKSGSAGVAYALSAKFIEEKIRAWKLPWQLYLGEPPNDGHFDLDEFKDDCEHCPDMVAMPVGIFEMGSHPSEKQHEEDESPVHPVTVLPFAIAKYEVTVAQWDACVRANSCTKPLSHGATEEHPVVNITWHDANDYVKWLSSVSGNNYRLPTEPEWEFAARGGTITAYWWGDEVGWNNARCKGCDEGFTSAAVGTYGPNPFGLYDTAGNVHEWVLDCKRHDDYEKAPKTSEPREGSDRRGECKQRLRRGGSFSNSAKRSRSANRSSETPNTAKDNLGLRVARTY